MIGRRIKVPAKREGRENLGMDASWLMELVGGHGSSLLIASFTPEMKKDHQVKFGKKEMVLDVETHGSIRESPQ